MVGLLVIISEAPQNAVGLDAPPSLSLLLPLLRTPWTEPLPFRFHRQTHAGKVEPFYGALKKHQRTSKIGVGFL